MEPRLGPIPTAGFHYLMFEIFFTDDGKKSTLFIEIRNEFEEAWVSFQI